MGKRIISQARGHGSLIYRVRKKAFKYKVGYLGPSIIGVGKVVSLINSLAHSAPLVKILIDNKTFINCAAQGIYQGQEIEVGGDKVEVGNIVALKHTSIGDKVFNIEKRPGDGGKMIRTSGGYATILKKEKGHVIVVMFNKKEVKLHENCRATVGVIAGQGRIIKPIVKAGKMHRMMKSRGKPWHQTSAVKVNAIDHPFGGGRGKRIKSKIAKRNAPPGRRIGHLRPKRTGKKKR